MQYVPVNISRSLHSTYIMCHEIKVRKEKTSLGWVLSMIILFPKICCEKLLILFPCVSYICWSIFLLLLNFHTMPNYANYCFRLQLVLRREPPLMSHSPSTNIPALFPYAWISIFWSVVRSKGGIKGSSGKIIKEMINYIKFKHSSDTKDIWLIIQDILVNVQTSCYNIETPKYSSRDNIEMYSSFP